MERRFGAVAPYGCTTQATLLANAPSARLGPPGNPLATTDRMRPVMVVAPRRRHGFECQFLWQSDPDTQNVLPPLNRYRMPTFYLPAPPGQAVEPLNKPRRIRLSPHRKVLYRRSRSSPISQVPSVCAVESGHECLLSRVM